MSLPQDSARFVLNHYGTSEFSTASVELAVLGDVARGDPAARHLVHECPGGRARFMLALDEHPCRAPDRHYAGHVRLGRAALAAGRAVLRSGEPPRPDDACGRLDRQLGAMSGRLLEGTGGVAGARGAGLPRRDQHSARPVRWCRCSGPAREKRATPRDGATRSGAMRVRRRPARRGCRARAPCRRGSR